VKTLKATARIGIGGRVADTVPSLAASGLRGQSISMTTDSASLMRMRLRL
jgi:hypothetical protein